MKTITADKFKANCLQLLEQVVEKHISFTITKYGKPVAKRVPVDQKPQSAFGYLKYTVSIQGDIISPIKLEWNADK